MAELTPTELRILALRSGAEDGTRHSVETLSRRFGVFEGRIREIEASGLSSVKGRLRCAQEPGSEV